MFKISSTEIALLVLFALTADLFSLLPIINVLVSLVVSPILYLYWKIKRVPAFPTVIAGTIELFPLISMLPAFTAGVLAVVLMDRMTHQKYR
ncbi:hypothetical protein A3H22_00410 [Candidatus Peribacteria bacterium RIFCSPLOWO2_12_FULL_55_15]|nr:MAG: hypothetical protein A2789_02515 [Candidatus Peribacteria bacterium RIFCSPHIGHO2_01_FULL_54_22]OGJ62512.1 MAG: hypothetical protein A3D12_02250 [Candidatus Peribacteria bacterium RIFCSPHIGHO2_02_FULL_55_24]OGJ64535.1 MAG: hypothetical protein A3E47_00195 [Candidatus Peribacteria bacterium RIFCSPHIGHO2_12_FULL_54_10]OGJ67444.1 MAG: hypothetical protein A2947_01655 [Candidatus Peribacteria bacterium RIFCSPLOWO2_01_FULL_54_110]OGJ69723.1 MAG: hypothetical protein A3H90_01495 [Candidatus Pe